MVTANRNAGSLAVRRRVAARAGSEDHAQHPQCPPGGHGEGLRALDPQGRADVRRVVGLSLICRLPGAVLASCAGVLGFRRLVFWTLS